MELTNTKKKAFSVFLTAALALVVYLTWWPKDATAEEVVEEETVYLPTVAHFEYNWEPPTYEGCNNLQEWFDTLKAKRAECAGISAQLQEEYSDFITDEQIAELDKLEQACVTSSTLARIDENETKISEIRVTLQEAKEAEEARLAAARVRAAQSHSTLGYSYSSGSSNSFKRDGIWRDSQYTYSWYSSNVLHHYRTNEWTPGSDGIYRDSNGRVCAASDDYALGTVVNTEKFGEVIITDTGVGSSGKLDIYTNF